MSIHSAAQIAQRLIFARRRRVRRCDSHSARRHRLRICRAGISIDLFAPIAPEPIERDKP